MFYPTANVPARGLQFASFLLLLHACAVPMDHGVASEDNAVYAAPPLAQRVTSLTIIDAQTQQAIQKLTPDATIALGGLPAELNLLASTSPSQVGCVRFDLDANIGFHVENNAPYTLLSTAQAGSAPWPVQPGVHTVTATPFANANLLGPAGTPLTITFTLDANAPSSGTLNANVPTTQSPNTPTTGQNTNTVVDPNAPATHIYDFTVGITDTSPNVSGRVDGTLVGGATLANSALVTDLSPSASGLQLPVRTFAYYDASFSVEQWFTWAQTASDYETLFSISTDQNHFLLAHPQRGDNGLFSVDLRVRDGQQFSITTHPPTAGTLTFMAVVYDATSKVLQLFIDGSLVDSTTVAPTVDLSALAGADSTGIGGFSPFPDPCFNGTTTRFIVQPVALTAQRVASDFANPATAGSMSP